MMRPVWMLLLLLASMSARAIEPPPGHELVPVIHLQIDGPPKFAVVALPVPPRATILNHGCVREFNATAIRCYALDVAGTIPVWITFDLNINQ